MCYWADETIADFASDTSGIWLRRESLERYPANDQERRAFAGSGSGTENMLRADDSITATRKADVRRHRRSFRCAFGRRLVSCRRRRPKLQTTLLMSSSALRKKFHRQPLAVLQAVHGIGPKTATALASIRLMDEARRTIDDCRAGAIDILTRKHPDYPKRLEEICDAPECVVSTRAHVASGMSWQLPS